MARGRSYCVEICLRILIGKVGTAVDSIVEEIKFGSDTVWMLKRVLLLL